jgi:hypothetical protein
MNKAMHPSRRISVFTMERSPRRLGDRQRSSRRICRPRHALVPCCTLSRSYFPLPRERLLRVAALLDEDSAAHRRSFTSRFLFCSRVNLTNRTGTALRPAYANTLNDRHNHTNRSMLEPSRTVLETRGNRPQRCMQTGRLGRKSTSAVLSHPAA